MDQEAIKSNLDGLERKILILLNERKTLKEHMKNITMENQRMKADIQNKDEAITRFKNDVKVDQIASCIEARNGSENNLELQKKVDDYILEIDRCIAHLNL